jgi:Protein of unknown function (DUF3386)
MSQTPTNTAAHEMLHAAYDRAYRYPENFAGFKAALRYSTDEESLAGTITIHSPDTITLELGGREGELQALQREIASLCAHRWHAPYSAGDGRYTLSLDENAQHPLGQLIIFHDDPFQSSYRIKDGSVVQVNRQMGPTRFTIQIQEHTSIEENRTLPRQFTVAYWDTNQKRLMRTASYTDHYIPVEGYYLPTYRRIIIYDDKGVSTHIIEFSAHKLA